MPQSKEVKNEQTRLRMEKMRNKGVTSGSVTKDNVTLECNAKSAGGTPYIAVETVPASYVQGITGKFKSLPKRGRFVTLTDGQVLDRLNQPEAHASDDFIQRMRACNESAYNFKPNQSSKERIKELLKGI